jgi:cytochrome c oxidase assembly protein subunit 15
MMLAKSKSAKFFRMALTAALVAYVAVVFNAYARLSEAGLGCPDWPGCYGKLFAPVTAQDIEQARQIEGVAKSEGQRVWKETTQRAIAVSLTFLLIRLTVLGWDLKKRKRSQQVLIPLATMLGVILLSVMGFITFDYRYKPVALMMQLAGGMAILALLWWIVMREQRVFRSVSASPLVRSLRPRSLLALGIVAGQMILGGWSMVNYAGLACPDFPTCQGSWWPPMDFLDAFTRWQDHGIDYEGRLLNLPAATAIHMAHRLGALITLMYVGWLALHLLRVGNQENLCRYGLLVLTLLLSQTALGIMAAVTHLPLAVVVGHNAVAALLLMSLVTLYHVVRPPRTA